MFSDDDRRRESEYIKSALYQGRSPVELHKAIDRAVVEYVRELRGASVNARHYEAQRDLLRDAASRAAAHLRQLGAYGSADKAVDDLDAALTRARSGAAEATEEPT